MDTSEDPDANAVLKVFDFLSRPDEMDTSESRGPGDGTDWGESLNTNTVSEKRILASDSDLQIWKVFTHSLLTAGEVLSFMCHSVLISHDVSV